ncbi:hypothetical protein [Phenylobacterium sp.]|jgi:hypothetical protein|uniref:hypothetical protein n=1 Tax=Phenylobacterium sp. TaxID=1871053 RepID=UPI002F406EDA
MFRILLCALSLSLLAAPIARAQDEAATLGDFFTGTLEIDVPAGDWSAKRYLAPDHTYREVGSDGTVRGTWAVRDGKVCTTAQRPVQSEDRAATYCNAILGKHAGDMWRDADPVTGNAVLFKLTAGRDRS